METSTRAGSFAAVYCRCIELARASEQISEGRYPEARLLRRQDELGRLDEGMLRMSHVIRESIAALENEKLRLSVLDKYDFKLNAEEVELHSLHPQAVTIANGASFFAVSSDGKWIAIEKRKWNTSEPARMIVLDEHGKEKGIVGQGFDEPWKLVQRRVQAGFFHLR